MFKMSTRESCMLCPGEGNGVNGHKLIDTGLQVPTSSGPLIMHTKI